MLPVIAAGLSAMGSLLGGTSAFSGGRARNRAMKAAARQTRQEAAVDAAIINDGVERAAGAAAVAGASAGGGWQGSAVDVLTDLEQRGRFNVRSAIWSGNSRAAAQEHEGAMAEHDGKMALITSVIEAGSSLAGGFARNAEAGKQRSYRSAIRARRMG